MSAGGLNDELQFNYWHDPTPLWSFERLREARYVELVYSDAEEDQDVNPADILNHAVENTEDPLGVPEYIEQPGDKRARGSLQAMYDVLPLTRHVVVLTQPQPRTLVRLRR